MPEQEPGAVEPDREIRGGNLKLLAGAIAVKVAELDRNKGVGQMLGESQDAPGEDLPEFAAIKDRSGLVDPPAGRGLPVAPLVKEALDRPLGPGLPLRPRCPARSAILIDDLVLQDRREPGPHR